jgi:hypothetical protein
MKIWLILGILAAAAAAVLFFLHVRSYRASREAVVQVENRFEFTAHGPYQTVAPLFGALAERAWAGDHWDPHFLYPQPAEDQPGEVFTVSHGHTHSTWVNTVFDLPSGHVQYVYFVPQAQVTVIDVNLKPLAASETDVKVAYRRTALNSRLNAHIKDLGRNDAQFGPEWASAIDAYLKGSKPHD